jgi:hypothetical protein
MNKKYEYVSQVMEWAKMATESFQHVASTVDSRSIYKQVHALRSHVEEIETDTLPSFAAALAFVNTKMIKFLANEMIPRGFTREVLYRNISNPVFKEKISEKDIDLNKVKEFLDILD